MATSRTKNTKAQKHKASVIEDGPPKKKKKGQKKKKAENKERSKNKGKTMARGRDNGPPKKDMVKEKGGPRP